MAWTQNELEELYQKVNKLAAEDADFRKELQADSRAAIEKIAGKELPEGFRLKFIENDPSYNATYVVPDITSGELNLKELQSVSGGSGDEIVIQFSCNWFGEIFACFSEDSVFYE